MALIGLIGRRKDANTQALWYAIHNTPSFIIDCANVANPHTFIGKVPPEQFASVYSVIAESIYRFRDALLHYQTFVQEKKIKHIIITSFDRLFNYQDERENTDIYAHAWELMSVFGRTYQVYVVVPQTTLHKHQAQQLCTQLIQIDKTEQENNGTHRHKPTYRHRHFIE